MSAITSLFVRKIVDAAGEAVDRDALLRSVGLDPNTDTDVNQMVSAEDYYQLLETIARTTSNAIDLPIRVGRSMRCDDYGAFGLAWKSAPTIRDSFSRAERYARLLSSVAQYEVLEHHKGAYFVLNREGERRLGMRLSNEATLASVASIVREVSPQSFRPLEVHCKHPAPSSLSAHEKYFECDVHFDSTLDALLVSAEDLARPNRLGDPAISQYLLAHIDSEISARVDEASFEQLVLRKISDSLSGGSPRAAMVAQEMAMSERTLNRRLSQEGLSFQDVLEKARRRLAEGLLLQSDHSIAEIAFLTGFSEQSSFSRAFKRWVNDTPAAFRQANQPN